MIVLDTDHLSCLEWGSTESFVLRERLSESFDQNVVVSIVSYEEQVRGWLALLAKIHDVPEQVHA
jgi:tRNA(fMet)-specific endonuclease VapC